MNLISAINVFFIIIIIIYFLRYFYSYEFYTTKKDIEYIFWSGGFDSTYLILYALFASDVIVQPIYIKSCLDNYTCEEGRKNKELEILSIEKIRNEIKKFHPSSFNRLLKTIFIDKLDISNEILDKAMTTFKSDTVTTRPINQYTSIAEICKQMEIVASIGIVKDDERWRNIKLKHIGTNKCSFDYDDNKITTNYLLFERIRFPCIHLTKKEMLENAKHYKFDNMLELSFSCWFPLNGQPCNICDMCKHRIIL